MACLEELNQAADKSWIGISRTTGQMQKFTTLGQFEDYQKALGCTLPVRPAPYVEPIASRNTIPTGFLEFKPRDTATQARFDATSDQWEGSLASHEAVKQGLFKEDSAETVTREQKPKPLLPRPISEKAVQPVQPVQPVKTNDVCSIQ
jgi:hypothetical protein